MEKLDDFNLEAMTVSTQDNVDVQGRSLTTTLIWTLTVAITTGSGATPYSGNPGSFG